MRKRHPEIAIVIPCYNDADYVAEAIRSIGQQTFENWECAVVDDGSTDDSLEVINRETSDDSRFTVLSHETNRGLPAARNTGIRATSAGAIAFLDSDDLLTRRSFEQRLQALQSDERPEVAGVYTGTRFVSEDTKLEDLASVYATGPDTMIDFISAEGECPFPVHAPLVRRTVLDRSGLFDESLRGGTEDWDLWYRVLRLGYVFEPSPSTTAAYRQRLGAMTRESAPQHVAGARRLLTLANERTELPATSISLPRPLPLPLWEYRVQIQATRRALRFMTMANLEGLEEQAKAILASLSVDNWALVERHVDFRAVVKGALRRVHGRDFDDSGLVDRLVGELHGQTSLAVTGEWPSTQPLP